MSGALGRLVALALLCAGPAFAQEAALPPPAPVAAPTPAPVLAPKLAYVALQTAAGRIVIALEVERAPITAANFLRYVDQKRFDGITFYRAMSVAPGFGLIQAGTKGDPKRVLKPIAHEPTTKTGLSHTDGAISMARAAPGSANGDFFITVGNLSSLDAKPGQPGDNAGFAAFGHVAEGMDVVHKILVMPAGGGGTGPMKGQMIVAPVTIISARRTKAPEVAPSPPAAPVG